MQRVHIANHLIEAQLIADLLIGAGIAARVGNVHASSALGEIPLVESLPQVWVENSNDAERARQVVAEFLKAPAAPERACQGCGEMNPGNFATCWQCQRVVAG